MRAPCGPPTAGAAVASPGNKYGVLSVVGTTRSSNASTRNRVRCRAAGLGFFTGRRVRRKNCIDKNSSKAPLGGRDLGWVHTVAGGGPCRVGGGVRRAPGGATRGRTVRH